MGPSALAPATPSTGCELLRQHRAGQRDSFVRRLPRRKSSVSLPPSRPPRAHGPAHVRLRPDTRRVSLFRSLKWPLRSCLHGKRCPGARHFCRPASGFRSAPLDAAAGFLQVWDCRKTSSVYNLLQDRIQLAEDELVLELDAIETDGKEQCCS